MQSERELLISAPSERQQDFFRDHHKYVAFGGARGGGKSWAVRVKALLLASRYAGIKILIIRKSYPELRSNHIDPYLKMLPHDVFKYNDSHKRFVLPNGSQILFRYCSNDADLSKFQGTEVDVMFIDEATQFTESQYQMLTACVRGVNDFPKRVYLTCNPGGVGHGWVKRLFIDRNYNEKEKGEDYSFIQSLVTDNKALMEQDPHYLDQLEMLPEKLRRAWLYGDWDIFEGQFFEEFVNKPDNGREYTHVIEPFEIPSGWKIYRSFDFGYAKPFSCAWWAIDYDGTAYRILELYGCTKEPNEGVKWTPDKIFAEIHKIETEHRWLKGKQIIGVADPSIWDASRGEAVVEVANRYHVFFSPGDNKRIPGWMQCHYRLAFDEHGFPMMYVFSTCKAFIRTIPLLQFDDVKSEDLDTDQEDHVADEFRYFCMARPIAPREMIKQAPAPDGIWAALDIDPKDLGHNSPRPRMEILS